MSGVPPYSGNNPFSSPTGQPQISGTPHNPAAAAAKNQMLILGIVFVCLGSAGLLGALFLGGSNLAMLLAGKVEPPPNPQPGQAESFYVGFYGAIAVGALSLILQPLVIFGGINMIRMKGRSVAQIAAVVLVVPCLSSCCVVGIPFGVWALIALNTEKVKWHFKSAV